eukprot:scaffold2340_cov32-Phaeocystis_antarctica.AAC.2
MVMTTIHRALAKSTWLGVGLGVVGSIGVRRIGVIEACVGVTGASRGVRARARARAMVRARARARARVGTGFLSPSTP